jgi:hypothetical protein
MRVYPLCAYAINVSKLRITRGGSGKLWTVLTYDTVPELRFPTMVWSEESRQVTDIHDL